MKNATCPLSQQCVAIKPPGTPAAPRVQPEGTQDEKTLESWGAYQRDLGETAVGDGLK